MKVKISYTTELENIPYECWRLMDYKIHNGFEFFEPLQQVESLLASHQNEDNLDVSSILEKIHKMRIVLSKYDQCLSDVNTILSDWAEYQLHTAGQQVTLSGQQKEDNE